ELLHVPLHGIDLLYGCEVRHSVSASSISSFPVLRGRPSNFLPDGMQSAKNLIKFEQVNVYRLARWPAFALDSLKRVK
ncbi:MAG: hypothetical protein ACYC9I_04040, partial [Desulfuromonadales bacterium]